MVVVCYGVSKDGVVKRTIEEDAIVAIVYYGVSRDRVTRRTLKEYARRKVVDVCVLDCNIVYAIQMEATSAF